jgi:iron complex transport system ATP-binding protein
MKLIVNAIGFSYNSHPVLSEVCFSLEPGELMCILGVNGAGKSTLLKCLNRILTPRCGSVLLAGEAVSGMGRNEVARRMGYVPQRNPDTCMTVFQTVLMGRKPHMGWRTGGKDFAEAEQVIRQIGLESLAMRRLCDLSGGQLQKVIIARALAQRPGVLLLDEPTSSLDLKNQLEVMGLIRDIVKTRSISGIIAIHDLNIAVRFADRFVLLKDGRIQAVATREHLTAEMIRQVYGVEVALKEFEGRLLVVPLGE